MSSNSTAAVKMDSRRLLGVLNQSAQSQVAMFENIVKRMGNEAKANWQLVALYPNQLYLEDTDTNTYFVATHKREKGGRITVGDLRAIQIVDEQKSTLFGENCLKLIDAIEEGDQKGMRAAFNKLAAQRFTSQLVPTSGLVRTRDGVMRRITVDKTTVAEDVRKRLVAAIVESLSDRVVLENGQVVSATINSTFRVRLPITEWTCRKSVCRHLRSVAENAYRSEGFRKQVYQAAKRITDGEIKEAVEGVKALVADKQEFCLLDRKGIQRLVENSLAGLCVFNQQLCTDTATLFYRTNLKVNKPDILKEWAATAKKAAHPGLLENVRKLEESKNFEASYDKFLGAIFEAVSPRDVTVDAYKTALKLLRDTPKITESPDLAGKIDQLVGRLSGPDVDHSIIAEVEDILAGAKSELDAGKSLDNYDMPEDEPLDVGHEAGSELNDLAGPDDQEGASKKGITITINSPLISIGNEESGGGEDLGDLGDLGDDELGGEEGDLGGEEGDLGDLGDLGGEEEGQELGLEGRAKPKTAVKEETDENGEWVKPWEKKDKKEKKGEKDEDCDDCTKEEKDKDGKWIKPWEKDDEDEDCDDEYAMDESVQIVSRMGSDYGTPAITEDADVNAICEAMQALVDDRGINTSKVTSALVADLRNVAKEAMESVGIQVPSRKLDDTLDTLAAKFLQKVTSEEQYKFGTKRRKGGLKRSSVNKSLSENAIDWKRHDKAAQGVLGEMNGIPFIYDYSQADLAILSEDGSIQVPVPPELYASAKAAVSNKSGSGQFVQWLVENLEQLRTDEDEALSEAITQIHLGGDGTMTVTVDGDADVTHNAEGEAAASETGTEMIPGGEAEFDMEASAEMEPVDDMEGPPDAAGGGEAPMPNFEGGDEGVEGEPKEGPAEGPPEEEEGEKPFGESVATEDHDITDPGKGSYDTSMDDKRELAKAKKPGAPGKELEGFDEKPKEIDTGKRPVELKPVKSGKNSK